jgi:hypothetical protein
MYNALILFCTYFSLGTLLMCVDRLISRVKWLSERNRQKRVNEYRAAAYAKKERARTITNNRTALWSKIAK